MAEGVSGWRWGEPITLHIGIGLGHRAVSSQDPTLPTWAASSRTLTGSVPNGHILYETQTFKEKGNVGFKYNTVE